MHGRRVSPASGLVTIAAGAPAAGAGAGVATLAAGAAAGVGFAAVLKTIVGLCLGLMGSTGAVSTSLLGAVLHVGSWHSSTGPTLHLQPCLYLC